MESSDHIIIEWKKGTISYFEKKRLIEWEIKIEGITLRITMAEITIRHNNH